MKASTVRPTYLLVDTSGSTVIDRWIDACNSVLPFLIEALEEELAADGGTSQHLSVLTYGTESQVLVGLSDIARIDRLPGLEAGGFSSLACGFRLLAETIATDVFQLEADGLVCTSPAGVLITHGLPTDPPNDVLDARASLTEASDRLALKGVAPAGTDPLALAGIGVHPCSFVNPVEAVRTLPAAVVDLLRGRTTE